MPRTIDVVVRANNVDRAKPGDKVTFTGMLVVCPDVAALTGAKVKVQGESLHRCWASTATGMCFRAATAGHCFRSLQNCTLGMPV